MTISESSTQIYCRQPINFASCSSLRPNLMDLMGKNLLYIKNQKNVYAKFHAYLFVEFLCHINEYFKVLFQLILLVAQYKYDRHFMSHLVIKSKVHYASYIGDLGLCQQVVDKKDNLNKIFGVIPYLAPEVLSKKPYTKESDIYSFGMIMWEFTTGKKPFHDRPHNHCLILDILKGERPQITDDTPEFYAELMKRCWDHNPENRPTAEEIQDCLCEYSRNDRTEEKKEIIKLAEDKQQEIIKSD